MADSVKSDAPESPADVFLKDIGTWDADIEVRSTPGGPVQRSKGVYTNRLIADGRWLVTDYRNETTGFEGHGIYGYDELKKKYAGVWVDAQRTFLTVAEGNYNESQRSLALSSEIKMAGRTLRWREVTETKDPDTQVFRSFMPVPEGGEFEMITVTYRRRRDS